MCLTAGRRKRNERFKLWDNPEGNFKCGPEN